MDKVCFVIPSIGKKAYQDLAKTHSAIEPPTWALLLSNAVRKKNYEPILLDYEADYKPDEEAADEIESYKPKLVVFVLYGQNPNSGTTMMIGASTLARQIKLSHPNLKIAFIGSHASALPSEVASQDYCDFAFINEGVIGLLDLLRTDLENELDKVPGMWYKDRGLIKPSAPGEIVKTVYMDELMPGYAWDLIDLKKYRAHFWHSNFSHENRTPFAALYTSLGCSFGCNFCMINIVNRTSHNKDITSVDSKGMRFWSPELILRELEYLYVQGVRTCRITDEMFFLNKKYYVPILEGVIKRGMKFNFWAYARVDSVRKDQLELFKEAGVNFLVNYMFGFPEENYENMQETLDLALELNTEHANFYAAMALPGSPLHLYARQQGWDIPKRFEEYAFLSYDCRPLRTKYLTGAEVLRFRDEAWHKYFTHKPFLDLVEKKFGIESRNNVVELEKIKLTRKILGD